MMHFAFQYYHSFWRLYEYVSSVGRAARRVTAGLEVSGRNRVDVPLVSDGDGKIRLLAT